MKRLIALTLLAMLALTLTACSPDPIQYQGRMTPQVDVEDILGDQLEVENPGLDIDVDVIVNTEED